MITARWGLAALTCAVAAGCGDITSAAAPGDAGTAADVAMSSSSGGGSGSSSGAGDGSLVKLPLAGGSPETLAASADVSDIALDATSVYWADGSGVMKLTPK